MKKTSRKIIHIDMDAFYASVEQLDNPALKGKPIAVGGDGPRGVVAAASYESRKFGVKSAMPAFKAKRKCPHLIFVRPRFSRYKQISHQIRQIMQEYTDLIEPLSLDEAYIDVTENKRQIDSAIKIAREIKKKIFETTGLTASAGVSMNKFLAKVASDINKPDGLSVILPKDAQTFIDQLPIEKFFGVGKATTRKMKALGIQTGYDLRMKSELDLIALFGKVGRYYYQVSRGEDHREVKAQRIRKSISVERTYDEDLLESSTVFAKLDYLIHLLVLNLERHNICGKTVNLKLRYSDFKTLTRSKTIDSFTQDNEVIQKISYELLESIHWDQKPIRLLGLGLSNLDKETKEKQLRFNF